MNALPLTDPEISADATRAMYYRALMARDTRFDGVFFTGVKTTGIYCRPVCTAKTPRVSSCEFFTNAAAAEAAGYRPCLLCRPELAPYALQQNLAYAVWQKIASGELNHQSESNGLEILSQSVGLSSRQLRRVLLEHFGVTPVELAQTQRLLFAKKLLQETSLAMVDVAYAAGFGSVRRFNALFLSRYGLAPTAIRRNTHPDLATSACLSLRLAYRPPYNWDTMLSYMAGRAIGGVESVDASSYARSVCIGSMEGWMRVTHIEDKHCLQLEIAPTLTDVLMQLISRVRNQFDLDANPTVIEEHLRQDRALAKLIRTKPGVRVTGAFDTFEIAVRAVLGQQVSVAGATTLSGRLAAKFGAPIHTPFNDVTHHFPQPALLGALEIADVAQIGLPMKRAETIRNLAQFATQGGFSMRPGTSLEEAIAHLKTIPGIGNWTAHYIAMRALRLPDAFPAGDLGLQKACAEDITTRLTEKQLEIRAANWTPWRSYAAFLLWNRSDKT
jgi:AraC family transcriptional regulator of adaptative response / DNA-3-methyladenine glycosylase II